MTEPVKISCAKSAGCDLSHNQN